MTPRFTNGTEGNTFANAVFFQVRIIRTAKQHGIKTVSVYTRADVASLHVSQADVAKLLPGPDASAYTDGEAIIKIAKEENAQAIIPGYGFLSENADFARNVGKAGLVWVGPSPEAIEVRYCDSSNCQTSADWMNSRPLASNMVGSEHHGQGEMII